MKLIAIVLLTILVMLQTKLWSNDGGLKEVWRHSDELALQLEESQQRQARNAKLEAEVKDLNGGLAAIEERARSELGMIRKGETFIQVVERNNSGFPHE
ncbi:MAG: cell division protein FtsB [Gammaproteobacteria bacterium]|nr:cell division protein FtsB [Gammaproteobacteria bacterium]